MFFFVVGGFLGAVFHVAVLASDIHLVKKSTNSKTNS